jgi:SAM-dependent methyltransferase
MNPEPEDTLDTLARATRAYRASRPYFYLFLRPLEAALLAGRLASCAGPIMDFGCGDGFFARQLAAPGAIGYGVDIDPALGREAAAVYGRFVPCAGDRLPFASGALGAILSNSVFEHLDAPERVLGELHRVLRPGGRLLATVTSEVWEQSLAGGKIFGAPYRAWMRRVQRHRTLWSAARWAGTLRAAGFGDVRLTGYATPALVRRVELFHYLTAPAWLAHRLTGRWDSPPARALNALYALLAPLPRMLATGPPETAPCILIEARKSPDV